jgi:hypothetical protein
MGVPYGSYQPSNHMREDFIDVECEPVEEQKSLPAPSFVSSQNNMYIVFSKFDGTIISWTQDLQQAVDSDNNFTIVRGYFIS